MLRTVIQIVKWCYPLIALYVSCVCLSGAMTTDHTYWPLWIAASFGSLAAGKVFRQEYLDDYGDDEDDESE